MLARPWNQCKSHYDFIIVGSGFLKANISVMVGQLYSLTDTRRDGAYTIFYMGINLGAAVGTILVGYLGETIGWAYGFGLAGIGMLSGLIVFVLGRKSLRGAGEPPVRTDGSQVSDVTLYGIGIAAVAVIWALVQYQDVIQTLLIISGIALLWSRSLSMLDGAHQWMPFAFWLLFFFPVSMLALGLLKSRRWAARNRHVGGWAVVMLLTGVLLVLLSGWGIPFDFMEGGAYAYTGGTTLAVLAVAMLAVYFGMGNRLAFGGVGWLVAVAPERAARGHEVMPALAVEIRIVVPVVAVQPGRNRSLCLGMAGVVSPEQAGPRFLDERQRR